MREVAAAAIDAFLKLYATGGESGSPQPDTSR
jgi:hypothetical protein